MKTLVIAAAAFALVGAPAFAQDEHKAHGPGTASAAPMDMSKMTPEEMHKHCSMLMGGKMQGRPQHDHAADKLGHKPATKAPTEAEMKAMHEKCAAHMTKDTKPAAK